MAQQEAFKLPQGWVCAPLTDAIDKIVGGGTPSKAITSYYEGEIPWMTVKDMNKFRLKDTVDHISQDGVDNSSTNVIPAGTPIVATRMSLGKIVRANFDSAINQDLKAIFLNSEINDYYFEYWYRSMAPSIEAMGTGTTVKGIKLTQLHALDFVLPPIPEQKRIVEKLDSLLALVDTIQQRLNNLPDIIKRFRQSVLAAAVSGKLTEQWRVENDCEKCTNIRLGDVVTPISQGWSPKCNNVPASEGDWGVIKTSAVQSINFVEQENKELPEHLEPRDKLQVTKGDILVTRAGPRVRCGITCLVTDIKSKLMICDKVYRFQVKEEKGVNKFLVLQLNSLKYLEDIEKLKTGISDSGMNLTQKKFKELLLEWPSIEEQTEIVRLVEQYFALADTLEKNLANAKQRVDNLTQSILAKAFKGELVPQDPNDEPADKLLERIKAVRQEAEKLEKATKKVAKASKAKKK